MSLPGIEDSYYYLYAGKRWYSPVSPPHVRGNDAGASVSHLCRHNPGPGSAEVVLQILHFGQLEGALLPLGIIDELCQTPAGLAALQQLNHVHWVGAPLSAKSGELLKSHIRLLAAIDSTESAVYFTKCHSIPDTWEYVAFYEIAGAVFEHRVHNLYELVFTRHPKPKPNAALQRVYGPWPLRNQRSLGRKLTPQRPLEDHRPHSDYIYLSHGEGLHASLLEPEIQAHPHVKSALIGGHSHPASVLIVEILPSEEEEKLTGAHL